MADTDTAALTTPTAPNAESTPALVESKNGFTRVPIVVKEEPKTPVPVAPVTPKPGEKKGDDPVVVALARTNKEARDLRAANQTYATQIADLEKKLADTTEGSKRAQSLEAEIADMIAHPRKYLERYKPKVDGAALQEILNGFAEDPEPENPRLAALEKAERDRVEADRKKAEDEEKARTLAEEEENKRTNAAVNNRLIEMVKAENAKAVNGEVGRWVLAAKDDSAVDRARREALSAMIENKWELTSEQANELVAQGLDQMEKTLRDETIENAKLLGMQITATGSKNSFSVLSKPEVDSSSQRKAPDVDGNSPTVNDKPKGSYTHGFTKG